MANSESPKANETPRNPILSPASTALPQPPKTSTNVPTASARYRFIALSPPYAIAHCAAYRSVPGVCFQPVHRVHGNRIASPQGTAAIRRGRVPLFATTKRSLHLFEGREIFLEPVDVLLHLHNGRPEFGHGAEGSARTGHLLPHTFPHAWHLRLGRSLTHRSTHEPQDEHPTQQTDKYDTSYTVLAHTVLLCLAAASAVSHHQYYGLPALSRFPKAISLRCPAGGRCVVALSCGSGRLTGADTAMASPEPTLEAQRAVLCRVLRTSSREQRRDSLRIRATYRARQADVHWW